MITEEEKKALLAELREDLQNDLAIFVGNNVLRFIAKIIGLSVLALTYYLFHNGYIKL